MSNYLIGIGGTGAKSVEAAVHFCAAGLMPRQPLKVVFVDSDVSNGNLERTRVTLQQYEACRSLKYGDSPLLSTPVDSSEPDVWNPVGQDQARPTVGELFRYNTMQGTHPEAAALFDVLYSRKERETTLERGFRGHPSVGAAVLADAADLGRELPWSTIRDQISNEARNGEPVRVFLAGSIFGGTGAAGFPTLGRLLREELRKIGQKNVGLGGVLMLPYFSFTPPQEVKDSGELYASSDGFLVSTKAALKYYQRNRSADTFDAVYLVGDQSLSPVERFSTGSVEQRNEAHFVELFAAAAARDFFFRETVPEGAVAVVATRSTSRLGWDDVPDGETVRQRLGSLARLAHAYLSVYYPALEEVRSGDMPTYAVPWYVDFFKRHEIDLDSSKVQNEIESIRDYSRRYLNWSLDMHEVGGGSGRQIGLLNPNAVNRRKESTHKEPDVTPVRKEFGNLVLAADSEQSPVKRDSKVLGRVWEAVCIDRARDTQGEGTGRFIAALYRACTL